MKKGVIILLGIWEIIVGAISIVFSPFIIILLGYGHNIMWLVLIAIPFTIVCGISSIRCGVSSREKEGKRWALLGTAAYLIGVLTTLIFFLF